MPRKPLRGMKGDDKAAEDNVFSMDEHLMSLRALADKYAVFVYTHRA